MQNIRNFSIIAHIDHGKSTLADRIIQLCGGLSEREMESQVLDSMALERERGITIKAQTAALSYKSRNGETYFLNLIDTPGHVDFSYEVSRSLSACEGALLVVDASQGVEAQTVANCYTAIELGVEVVPVLNKIDLPAANPEQAIQEIEDVIGIDAHDAVRASAKTGEGVQDILEMLIDRVPPPKGDPDAPLQALIIDSWFDNYVGVVMLVRMVNAFVNGAIAPITDDTLYGTPEYWTIPADAGDCEDIVLLKKKILQQKGLPPEALRITVVLDEQGEGHAVLTLVTAKGDFILDNRRNDIRSWSATNYTMLKRQSATDPRKWVSLEPSRSESAVGGTASK